MYAYVLGRNKVYSKPRLNKWNLHFKTSIELSKTKKKFHLEEARGHLSPKFPTASFPYTQWGPKSWYNFWHFRPNATNKQTCGSVGLDLMKSVFANVIRAKVLIMRRAYFWFSSLNFSETPAHGNWIRLQQNLIDSTDSGVDSATLVWKCEFHVFAQQLFIF